MTMKDMETKGTNNKLLYLADIVNIYSWTKYKELLLENAGLQNKKKLFVHKVITPNSPTCVLQEDTEKSQYVIISDEKILRYVSFFLNSSIGKLFLICGEDKKRLTGMTNLSQLRKLQIPSDEDVKYPCEMLELLINYLTSLSLTETSEELKRYASTILRFFIQLRDSIVLELLFPELFDKTNISVLLPWKNEVDKLPKNLENDEFILLVFDSLVQPDNELMANVNKMRVFMTDFVDFIVKERQGNGMEDK